MKNNNSEAATSVAAPWNVAAESVGVKQPINLKKKVMNKKMNAEEKAINDAMDNDLNMESDSEL